MAGPGTELKKLLGFFKIVSNEGCDCDKRSKMMDQWGPDLCEANRSIIISWLAESARNRKLPFSYFLANTALTVAIRRARASKRQ